MNGTNTIRELRRLVSEDEIELSVGLKLLYESHADVLENQHELSDAILKLNGLLETELKQIKEELILQYEEDIRPVKKAIRDNFFFKLGRYMERYPKLFMTGILLFFFLFNVWLNPGTRRAMLSFFIPLGFPTEWVELLTSG